jgi:hypothetical protein
MKVGDRVHTPSYGDGEIITITEDVFGIKAHGVVHDTPNTDHLHGLSGSCHEDHGYWYAASELTVIETKPPSKESTDKTAKIVINGQESDLVIIDQREVAGNGDYFMPKPITQSVNEVLEKWFNACDFPNSLDTNVFRSFCFAIDHSAEILAEIKKVGG